MTPMFFYVGAIFQHFNMRSEEVLRLTNFIAMAGKWGWQMDDIKDGLKWGVDNGWIEEKEGGGIMLTEAGFKEM